MATNKEIATLIAKLSLDSSEFTKGMDKVKSSMSIKEAVSTTGKAFATIGGAATATAGLMAKAAIDFESSFAGVRKTVEAPIGTDANEFFQNLEKDIRSMAMEVPSSVHEIASVYEAAGQLGIPAEHLTTFSRAMLDLGSATNLGAQEAAITLARFTNITGTGVDKINNLGSSIVALGNNMATSEREIADFAQNIALSGTNAGMYDHELMGWAAAMSSVGLEAGFSSTAFSRFTDDVTRSVASGGEMLEILSKTAGMTSEDFTKYFKEDASDAISTFLEGLGKLGSDEQLAVFDALEIKQVHEIKTLGALANNHELLARALNISNEAYQEGTALSYEAAMRNATMASQLIMLKGQLYDIAIDIGQALMPSIRSLVEWLQPIVQKFAAWAKQNPELITGILKAGMAIGALGVAMLGILKVISVFKTIGSVFKAFSSIGKLGSVFTSLGGAITKLGSVFLTAGKAVLGFIAGLNPIILIIGAIIAVVALLYAAWKNNWLGMRDILTNFWENTLQPFFQKIGDWLAKIPAWFQEAAGNIRQFLNSIGGWFKQAFADIGSFFSGIGSWFSNAFSGIADWVSNAFVGVIDWFKSAPAKIGEAVSTWWDNVKAFVSDFISKFVGEDGLNGLGEKIKGVITSLWSKITFGISQWWTNVKTAITTFMSRFAGSEGIASGGEGIKTAITDLWKKIKDGIGQWWDNVKASVTEFLENIKTEISNFSLIQAAADLIENFKTGIITAWETFKQWFKDLFTGLFDFDINLPKLPKLPWQKDDTETESEDKTVEMISLSKMIDIDSEVGIPQAVLDSFGALNTLIEELNVKFTTLAGLLGSGDTGLMTLLSTLEQYILGTFTKTLTSFATFIGVEGVLGMAITKLTQLFSMEGSTTALKQVLMSISDYMSIDLTTTFTTFGTFIGPEGTFGQALNKLIKTLYEEGSETSLYSAFKKVTDYLSGDITIQFTDFDTKLRTVFIPGWEFLAKILYFGKNTTYNALGAIQGVLESIEEMMQRVKDKIDYQLIPSFLRLQEKSGEAEGALDVIAAAARSVSYAMSSAANQVYALIDAYTALQAITDVGGGSGTVPHYGGRAEGGPVYRGSTYIVGERGPEIFTPRRSGYIIPNDEAFGGNRNSQRPIHIEIHDIYGDANLEQRIKNGVTLGLREAQFHGIGA